LCIFLLYTVVGGIIPHYWFPVHYRWFLWFLTGVNLLVAVVLFFRMPESPRWLEARERRDQARQAVTRMEARVRKRHPVLPEPDLSPYEVVAQEKTPWWAPFGRQYVFVTVFLLVVMVLGYGGIVYGGASQVLIFLTVNRGYGAGFVFAMTAWAGVVATAVYLLNAYFGDRLERKWTQLIGAIVFAGAYWGLYETRGAVSVYVFYSLSLVSATMWLWSMDVYIPQNHPTRMRLLGHRLDRRRGPPGRLGRRPDRRSALHRDRPAALLRVHHDPVRAAARPPDRDLRETPAPARAGRAVPVDAGPPAGSGRRPQTGFGARSRGHQRAAGRPARYTSRKERSRNSEFKVRRAWT
jgi:Sugar (and other) transporter